MNSALIKRLVQETYLRGTHAAKVAPSDNDVTEPEDRELLALVERYCAAFENGDGPALTTLLQADVRLEMPPYAMWFTGRDACVRRTRCNADDPDVGERTTRGGRLPARRTRRDAGPCDTCPLSTSKRQVMPNRASRSVVRHQISTTNNTTRPTVAETWTKVRRSPGAYA